LSKWKYKVEITGLEDLKDDLKALSEIDKKQVKDLLKKATTPMVQTMKANVGKKSGRLAKSIKLLNPDNPKFPFTVLVGPDYTPDNKGTMTIAALASVQEYGAVARIPRKGAKYKKVLIGGKWITMSKNKPFKAIPPRPFFRPAVDKHQSTIVEDVYFGVQKIILNSKTKIIK